MLYLHVYIHVKPECIDAFVEATLANVQASLLETGNLGFDVVQEENDPQRFVFVEAWRDAASHAAHRDTLHYIKWREAVNPMMATHREVKKFKVVYSGLAEETPPGLFPG